MSGRGHRLSRLLGRMAREAERRPDLWPETRAVLRALVPVEKAHGLERTLDALLAAYVSAAATAFGPAEALGPALDVARQLAGLAARQHPAAPPAADWRELVELQARANRAALEAQSRASAVAAARLRALTAEQVRTLCLANALADFGLALVEAHVGRMEVAGLIGRLSDHFLADKQVISGGSDCD